MSASATVRRSTRPSSTRSTTFCRETLEPLAAEIDAKSLFAARHLPALAGSGSWGSTCRPNTAAPRLDAFTLFEAIARIAGACASTASMVTAHFLATDSIRFGGDEAQKARYLPGAASGERLGAFALTEPGAGSNPLDMTTLARREGDGYRLKGVKHFISNAGAADFLVVYAKTDPEAGAKGISAFVVEPGEGVSVGPAERTMGLKGGHVFEVALDLHVAEANRLGAEGSGFRTALKTLDPGRLDIAACAVGIADAAFARACDWAKSRKVGGAADRRIPGPAMDARRHGDRHRRRARPGARERARSAPRASASAWKRRSPSSTPPRWPRASPTRRCRSTAATAT